MTDVVQIARMRRAELAGEIARLDRFIRMAAALEKYQHGGYDVSHGQMLRQTDGSAPDTTESVQPALAKRLSGERLGQGNTVDKRSDEGGAKRRSGRFLENALHFIGEDVTAKNVTAVPSAPQAEAPASEPVIAKARSPEQPPEKDLIVEAETETGDSDGTSDHFLFSDQTDAAGAQDPIADPIADDISEDDDVLELGAPKKTNSSSVDIHIGQKLRQRRWMIGMSRQQLGDVIGVGLDEIRNYEMGTDHVGPSRMWQIASALDVPMSYFFEELEGQSENGDAARGAVLSEAEARMMLHSAAQGAPRSATQESGQGSVQGEQQQAGQPNMAATQTARAS